jgi:aspartate-semialdehyde dehydrogenase
MKTIGVVGSTGAVGQEILEVLFQKKFSFASLHLFASSRSAGKKVSTPFGEMMIEEFSVKNAEKCDIVFLAVGGAFAKEFAPQLAEKGIKVIDNSSAFRFDDNTPLIIPQVNKAVLHKNSSNIIANPNCTTAILAMALYPIYKEFGLKKVIVSTYQATSGAGQPGMEELIAESKNYLNGEKVGNEIFAYPIAFNLIPHIDAFQENDYTKEEMKVTWETQKIFGDKNIPLSCTAVRIPTFRAHAESVTIETEKPVDVQKIREILHDAPGVDVTDDIEHNLYPMPLTATQKYNIEIGRIRKNIVFGEHGLDFFVCGDQLLRGAALNAVEIAEELL